MGRNTKAVIDPRFVELVEKFAMLTPKERGACFASEYADEQFTSGIGPEEIPSLSQRPD